MHCVGDTLVNVRRNVVVFFWTSRSVATAVRVSGGVEDRRTYTVSYEDGGLVRSFGEGNEANRSSESGHSQFHEYGTRDAEGDWVFLR